MVFFLHEFRALELCPLALIYNSLVIAYLSPLIYNILLQNNMTNNQNFSKLHTDQLSVMRQAVCGLHDMPIIKL